MLLIKHFSKQAASDVHKNTPECPESIVRLLKTYSFPGNIRELKTMIYDVVSITESNTLPYSYFKEYITAHQGKGEIRGIEQQEKDTKILYSGQFPSLEEVENFFIKEALKKAGNIQSNAANLLGISKYALHRMLKKKKNE